MSSKLERIRLFNDKQNPLSITVGWPLPEELKAQLSQMASQLPPDEFPVAARLFPIWERLLTYWQQNDIEDDRVRNVIYPKQYDQGIYGAMFGAKMESLLSPDDGFGWASSNSSPFEDRSYEDLLALKFDPENKWLRRMKDDLAYFAEQSRGRFCVSTIITIDGFNFGHQIAGTRVLEDIYTCPETIKALLSLAPDINIRFVEFQRKATGESCENGTFNLGGYFPDRTPAMSVDTYNMCSPAVYAEFGRPYHQRLIDHFGGGTFHLHGNGRHLLPEVAKLSGFAYFNICDDGAAKRAFDDRENVRKLAGNLLIEMSCGPEELAKAIREKSLVPARYSTTCANRDEGLRLLEQFRNYRI